VFPAGSQAPALIFLRGGYWRFGSKDERRFPALAWHKRGVTWISAGYRLAPEASLAEIVEDALAVWDHVTDHAEALGIDPARIHLVGNSAGAHLAAMVAAQREGIASLTVISGLFDLEPLLQEEVNSVLRLNPDSAERLSPMHHLPPTDLPVTVCVGGDESAEFKWQSRIYAECCEVQGNPVQYVECPGQHHIGVIGECGAPGTPVFTCLERQIGL